MQTSQIQRAASSFFFFFFKLCILFPAQDSETLLVSLWGEKYSSGKIHEFITGEGIFQA